MNKQKLKEQIDTMREELAKMETELAECEKVELKYIKNKGYYINGDGYIDENVTARKERANSGSMRETKELAEIASKNMVTRNKLEAYAHQIDPEWRMPSQPNDSWYIYVNMQGVYSRGCSSANRLVGCVYMSKSTAEQICEWLNDGRIEL